jgi:predicted nucleotidyltransferase
LLVGAAARDLLLVHVHGQRVRRATKDVDFAVAIGSWEAYEQLQKRLMDHHGFRNDSQQVQRLFFGKWLQQALLFTKSHQLESLTGKFISPYTEQDRIAGRHPSPQAFAANLPSRLRQG